MNIILFEKLPQHLPRSDSRADHLLRILKYGAGDRFRAGIVNGPVGEARILSVEHEGLELEWRETGPPVELYPLELIVGFVRPICAKRILRDAASLGVRRLLFTPTDTGEKSYREAKLWKSGEYRRYLLDGLQQAGATCMPELRLLRGVGEACELAKTAVAPGGRLLLDNEGAGSSLTHVHVQPEGVIAAIGSERGWSSRERERFKEAGFRSASMGNRILRTETACCAGAAMLLSRMGCI
jgi:RsmE family RNA methyltransferase